MSTLLSLRLAGMLIPPALPGLDRVSHKSLIGRLLSALAVCTLAGVFASNPLVAVPASVLIVAGTDGLAQTSASVLNTELTNQSFTVTVVNTGVPGSLAGFQQIYDLRYNNNPAFTSGEMNQYLTFLNAAPGNAIFLIGENTGFNVRNALVNAFINLAGGGIIGVPATTSQNLETVTPPFTGPNAITTVKFAACGLVDISAKGRFASSEAGGGCSLFFEEGTLRNAPTGALVVVYDVNFIGSAPNGGAVNEVPFRLNLEQFIAAPPTAPPVTPPVTSAAPLPTPSLGAWGMIFLAGMLLLLGTRAAVRATSR